MKKLKLNILIDKTLRLKLIKTEFFKKILKSNLQNNNLPLYKKNYINFILTSRNKSKLRASRRLNTCLITGSRHSITHKTNFSRQQNKRFIILNKLDNLRIFK